MSSSKSNNHTNATNNVLICLYNVSSDREFSQCHGPHIVVTPFEIFLAVFLGIFILSIFIGNMFVILSVLLFREMRTLTNGLICSLATADVFVALIVLPISLLAEITGHWTLGRIVCDFWITSDVFCCTASILNIVVIALDRYWLITKNVNYTHNTKFSRHKICLTMVTIGWICSGVISASPLFGWKRGDEHLDSMQCLISQDLGYTIFSTVGAFYFPLGVILIVYYKIFKVAKTRAKSRSKARAVHPSMASTAFSDVHNGRPRCPGPARSSDSNSPQASPQRTHRQLNGVGHAHKRGRRRSRTRSSARTLGLIIGAFIMCWSPFFLIATVKPFCVSCEVPPVAMSITLWLGYSNSLLNPAIYAIWDKNFRRSFKRLATCDIRWTTVF